MKTQTKTLLQFLLYLFFIFGFCYWYKELIMESLFGKSWFDVRPFFLYILFLAIFTILFFVAIKLRVKFSVTQLSYLTTRSFALGLVFYIAAGAIVLYPIDEYYLLTTGVGSTILFVLSREKMVFHPEK